MRFFRRGDRSGVSGRMSTGDWRKSTRSWANGDCLEVGQLDDGAVGVRDSKNAAGPVLAFAVNGWNAFLADVRAGRLRSSGPGPVQPPKRA